MTFDLEKVQNDVLKETNALRKLHGASPLELKPQLSKYAQEWATRLAKNNMFEHRTNAKYGENIYKGSGVMIDGKQAVKLWYNEIEKYSFEKAEFSPYTGHFTQLVWKGSKDVGIGVAEHRKCSIIVCNYNPPGNIVGKFKENVVPKQE